MILLVNQHTVPLFTDVVNAFAKTGEETRLFTGLVEKGAARIASPVKMIDSIAYDRRSAVTRLATWIMFSCHYFFYLLFCKKPSCVLVVTNPPIAPFITAVIARVRGIRFYIAVFDLYPEALSQAGISNDNGLIYKMWQRSNKWTFRKANGLITLSESMKSAVARYVDGSKITVIFNWADIDYIKPVEKSLNPFVAKHSLAGKLVVMYSGNMGLTHDLESLMDAAFILKHDSKIIFVLVGQGGQLKKLEAIKEKKQLDNVMFLPYQSAVDFPDAMAAADIGIVTLGTGAEGISVPSKTYVNMAAGLAIIAISPANSELGRIVQHFSMGHVVLPGEPEKIARHIQALASNQVVLSQLKSNARKASLNFTPANAQQYVDILADK